MLDREKRSGQTDRSYVDRTSAQPQVKLSLLCINFIYKPPTEEGSCTMGKKFIRAVLTTIWQCLTSIQQCQCLTLHSTCLLQFSDANASSYICSTGLLQFSNANALPYIAMAYSNLPMSMPRHRQTKQWLTPI
jgi:hypothetical protein